MANDPEETPEAPGDWDYREACVTAALWITSLALVFYLVFLIVRSLIVRSPVA